MVPAFVEAGLDQLYKHVNSSLSHYAVRRKARGASTYIACRGGQNYQLDASALLAEVGASAA